MQVSWVLELRTTLVQADPPTVTVVPSSKREPVIVSGVPPLTEPDVGETAVIDSPALFTRPQPARKTVVARVLRKRSFLTSVGSGNFDKIFKPLCEFLHNDAAA